MGLFKDLPEKQSVKITMPKIGGARPGAGRPKGVPNKITSQLKEAILEAATLAGNKAGLVGYLQTQARKNPGAFLTLLGKVLPLQVGGDPDNPLSVVSRIERVVVNAAQAERENASDRNAESVPTAH